MTLLMWIATAAWLLLVLGVYFRKSRKIHIPCVLTAIVLDTSLVLYLQLTRDAVQKAVGFEMQIFQQLHVVLSSIAFVLYIPAMILGLKLIKDPASSSRASHIKIASTAFVFRTLGFLFMFSMWKS